MKKGRKPTSSRMWVYVGVWVFPWGIVDLCHITDMLAGLSWKLLIWFSLLYLASWIPFIISGSNMHISLYIFEESCFCSLLPSRQPPHLPPHIPGISRDSVLGCSSECPAHRGGVLSLSPLPKPVFEEILLFLILTVRTFIKLVSSRLA